ncbi:MAG: efflux RND transporter periplasmic adaptor subunit [Labilithrix sp.]|nr:efflux RND transporter periplasmic adaptor subunit [Labilithrix sp.]
MIGRRVILGVGLFVVAAAIFWTVVLLVIDRSPPAPAAAIEVQAVEAPPAIDELDRDFAGVLFSPSAVEVAPTVEGRVATVAVKVGDVVEADAVLATLDDRMHKDQLAVAEAGRRAASAEAGRASVELVQARDRRDRRAGVVKVGDEAIAVVSAEEASDAKLTARAAGARAAAAGAAAGEQAARVRALKTALAETQLRAPFAGVVATVYVGPGSFVRPGMPAVRVVDTRALSVRFAVPEERASAVGAGQGLAVRLDERTLAARVTAVAPEVEPASRTVFIEGALDVDVDAAKIVALAGRVVRVEPGVTPGTSR